MSNKELSHVDNTGQQRSSILRKLSRKSSSSPSPVKIKNSQDEDDVHLDESKRKNNDEDDNEIDSDFNSKISTGFNTEGIASTSTIQESEVVDEVCPNCEILGEKCSIHAAASKKSLSE